MLATGTSPLPLGCRPPCSCTPDPVPDITQPDRQTSSFRVEHVQPRHLSLGDINTNCPSLPAAIRASSDPASALVSGSRLLLGVFAQPGLGRASMEAAARSESPMRRQKLRFRLQKPCKPGDEIEPIDTRPRHGSALRYQAFPGFDGPAPAPLPDQHPPHPSPQPPALPTSSGTPSSASMLEPRADRRGSQLPVTTIQSELRVQPEESPTFSSDPALDPTIRGLFEQQVQIQAKLASLLPAYYTTSERAELSLLQHKLRALETFAQSQREFISSLSSCSTVLCSRLAEVCLLIESHRHRPINIEFV